MTSRSEVHHANHYTIKASYKKGQIFHVETYNVLLFGEVKFKMHITYNEYILVHWIEGKTGTTPLDKAAKYRQLGVP